MDKVKLLAILRQRLTQSEFDDICYELDIPADDFVGGKSDKIRDLITYLDGRQRLNDLILWLTEERPDIDLTEVLDLPKSKYINPENNPADRFAPQDSVADPDKSDPTDFAISGGLSGCSVQFGTIAALGLLLLLFSAIYFGLATQDDRSLPNPFVTHTAIPTNTPSPTATPTLTNTPTKTATPTPTNTATPSPEPTETATAENTPTATPSPTETGTPTITPTPSETATPTQTGTPTETSTPSATPTPSNTPTPSPTATSTPLALIEPPPADANDGDAWTRPRDGMTMSFIPGGSFKMRDPSGEKDEEGNPLLVSTSLNDYWIDQTEVTFEMYDICVQSGSCEAENASELVRILKSESIASTFSYPVVQVNWSMAETYCQWTGGDLPTEAQWEYAAGSRPEDTAGAFLWEGIEIEDEALCSYAHFNNCPIDNQRGIKPAPVFVGQKTLGTTEQGVSDMAGNVYEWTRGIYEFVFVPPTSNGPEPEPESNLSVGIAGASPTQRVLKGGSFVDESEWLTVHFRNRLSEASRRDTIGFRCVVPVQN